MLGRQGIGKDRGYPMRRKTSVLQIAGWSVLFGAIGSFCPLHAAIASSANYDFTYAVAASAGVPSQSTNYSTVGAIRTTGSDEKPASSVNYSITPVIGSTISSSAKISNWQVY